MLLLLHLVPLFPESSRGTDAAGDCYRCRGEHSHLKLERRDCGNGCEGLTCAVRGGRHCGGSLGVYDCVSAKLYKEQIPVPSYPVVELVRKERQANKVVAKEAWIVVVMQCDR